MNNNSMKLNLIQKAGYNTKWELDELLKENGIAPPTSGGVKARIKLVTDNFSYKQLVRIFYNK